ncbi:serine hydrolase [Streptoalloteichus hindustanus]|uniref:CubicO group peptidase, beta-lactamase class C family n=1 Tax=Streptoalloteichus hindustanus TaxID=2017 RepID=A0A1M5IDF4_STRHI|nr:serine hydrolase [Streptoalloteichus hindustanus]SHG26408.1 CubicO group peptidase, beta-lactamase class C family [Streptoalloteichus hindustanus]
MQKFDTPAPISAVLDIPAGRVQIVAAERADTVVEVLPADAAKSRDVKAAEQTTVACGEGVLRIKTPTRNQLLGPSGAVEVTVHLPAGSRVEAKAAAAEFRAVGRLGDVAFDGAHGVVEVDEAAGVRLAAHAGDVSVGRLGGPAEISTQKGDIRIAEAVHGTVVLRTEYGAISIGAAHGVSASLDAGTSYGRIRNALRNTEGAAAQLDIRATTSYGDISAHSLPGDSANSTGAAVAPADDTAPVAAGQERPELQQAVQAVVDAGFASVEMRVRDERGEWVGRAGVSELGGTAEPPVNGQVWAGSVIKTFTATLVLQLVAEGRIELDGPVADHLPELGLDERITVRMLLRHTSGLYNYTGELDADGTFVMGLPSQGKAWVDNRFHTYRPEELVRFALSKPARFEPGTDQSYSNTNYTLALLLIEKVTGRSYAEEMRRRILEPLGLSDTVVSATSPDLPGPHAHGYYRFEDAGEWKVVDVSRQNPSLLAGAGDLITTAKDLSTFVSALLGGELLPAPLLIEMLTPHGKLGLGLGLWVQDLGPDGTIVHHNGGAPGGYGALMISTLDGSRTLTASLTTGEVDPAAVFPTALAELIRTVFATGQAGSTDEAAEQARPTS